MESKEIQKSETQAFSIINSSQIAHQVQEIQKLMQEVMLPDTHFGTIPGCGTKPTLLQPGAQKLKLMFQLADKYDVVQTDLQNGHREYRASCILTSKSNGSFQGSGEGICSTMESKYRYRGSNAELTGKPVPSEYWDNGRDIKYLGGKGFSAKKNEDTGLWEIAKSSGKAENPDIADVYNTVLKMACKRALVAAVLNTTAASDIFTQDLEDMEEVSSQSVKEKPKPEPTEMQKKLGDAMRRADAEGIKPKTIREWSVSNLGRDIVELNDVECERALKHVEGLIEDMKIVKKSQKTNGNMIKNDEIEPEFYENEVSF